MSASPQLKIINNHAYANSLDLAKHFCKKHHHVLRDIQNIILSLNESKIGCVEEFFSVVNYRDAKGEIRPMYQLSRDGFALVAMGFTGAKALEWKIKYINAFNQLETELNARIIRDKHFGQLKFRFPELGETLEDSRQSMTVSYAVARLTELGLMIPTVSRGQLIGLIKRRTLDGFNDGRQWNIYADSFNRFIKMRSGQAV